MILDFTGRDNILKITILFDSLDLIYEKSKVSLNLTSKSSNYLVSRRTAAKYLQHWSILAL